MPIRIWGRGNRFYWALRKQSVRLSKSEKGEKERGEK